MKHQVKTSRGTFEITVEDIHTMQEQLDDSKTAFVSFGNLGTQKRNIYSIAPTTATETANYTLITVDGGAFDIDYSGTIDEAAQKANDTSKAFIEIGGVLFQRQAFDWIIPKQ